MLPPRIFGEPSLFHSVRLLVELPDTPKTAASENAQERAQEGILPEQGRGEREDADYGKKGPYPLSEVVFTLYDDGVEKTDHKEGSEAYGQSEAVHEDLPLSEKNRMTPLPEREAWSV